MEPFTTVDKPTCSVGRPGSADANEVGEVASLLTKEANLSKVKKLQHLKIFAS
jgi:hypothetical protein